MQCSLIKFYKIMGIAVLLHTSLVHSSSHYTFCEPESAIHTELALKELYAKNLPTSLANRIQYLNQLLLNKPYELTALGEGKQGQFDQAPLYRLDAFDCQTYVETILALALTNSPQQFKHCIQNIRYAHGKIDYTQRHHFTSPDWNAYNQRLGVLKDITTTIFDRDQRPIAYYAQTTIDPANWYRHFNPSKIRLCGATSYLAQKRLHQLQDLGQSQPLKSSRLAYIPIQTLITKDKNSRYILEQIPNGAIIEIVRPDWDLTKAIGTHLNVSHMGFAVREQGDLYFYNASSLAGKSYRVSLEDYLISMLSQPTIQGINIQIVLPTHLCQHK